jgi:ABC-type phosphate transport system permease subunit
VSVATSSPPAVTPPAAPAPAPRPRRPKLRTPLSAHGEPALWLTGGSLILCLVMVIGLVVFVVRMGLGTFWPGPIEQVVAAGGVVHMGEVTRHERFTPSPETLEAAPPAVAERMRAEMDASGGTIQRRLFRTGNYELTQRHFHWVDDASVEESTRPEWALIVERIEWGRFYGEPVRFLVDDATVAEEPAEVWSRFTEQLAAVQSRRHRIVELDKEDLGRLRRQREHARLAVRDAELTHGLAPEWVRTARALFEAKEIAEPGDEIAQARIAEVGTELERLEQGLGRPTDEARAAFDAALREEVETTARTAAENDDVLGEIRRLERENARFAMVLRTSDGREQPITLDAVVRAYPANQLSFGDKAGVYFSRWWEFLTEDPREANSAGGVFPAIVGTVLMTIIMAVLVVPFGVMAALYLREYAKSGPLVSAVRIAINNLAGVPSIVFGVFGLGFFCYGVGGFIDGGPTWVMPKPAWFVILAGTVLAGTAACFVMVRGAIRPGQRAGRLRRLVRNSAGVLWLTCAGAAVLLIATTPFFDGFFRASLPNPTFGKGALIWASFTLALLTLPVVIVATEEALAAVPNSMREGSYACGAGKWQTIKRIVLPRAMPGIMTGTILAMARGAGEVAPLMLVGAVKFVGELPISASPGERFGIDRSFMHLGFHIYDLGFQSQNSEAAKPLVFTTTLLLITIIAGLNLLAVALRSRLRRRFVGAQF